MSERRDGSGPPSAGVQVRAVTKSFGEQPVLHGIDLDVLDPSEFEGLDSPVPFGLSASTLVELIRAVRVEFELAGAGITEFAPSSPANATTDLPTILRIIGALTAK